jgi:hypothetical protein
VTSFRGRRVSTSDRWIKNIAFQVCPACPRHAFPPLRFCHVSANQPRGFIDTHAASRHLPVLYCAKRPMRLYLNAQIELKTTIKRNGSTAKSVRSRAKSSKTAVPGDTSFRHNATRSCSVNSPVAFVIRLAGYRTRCISHFARLIHRH